MHQGIEGTHSTANARSLAGHYPMQATKNVLSSKNGLDGTRSSGIVAATEVNKHTVTSIARERMSFADLTRTVCSKGVSIWDDPAVLQW
jgi:hypothetical protein